MLYHYKMNPPTIITGASGDGSRNAPWYWYSKSSGMFVSLNNDGTSGDDNHRLYLRVKLQADTLYSIGQTAPGGDDGKIWLFDQNFNQLTYADDEQMQFDEIQYTDTIRYTPQTTGIYIIGAGTYADYNSTGDYKVICYPAPQSDSVPTPSITYPTSEGFNDFGKAIKYRSAKAAQCSPALIVPGYIWGYRNGRILPKSSITATRTGSAADAEGYFAMGNNDYFDFNSTVMTGSAARTFVLQATISSGTKIQFIDGGAQAASQMFGLGWGRDTNYLFYHFWSNDGSSWLNLSPGSYMLAFVYTGSSLIVYKDGVFLGSYTTSLNTGTAMNYRIGRYGIDDWYSNGSWKSNFCAVYDKALTQDEIKKFKQ